ncbi:MAG: hemolysin III family protein [Lachnospira sp.]|nr:hemolysin III family protein [Lachnospira sp.]
MSNTAMMKSGYTPGRRMHIKDPGSSITHFIGMVFAVFGTAPIIMKAATTHNPLHIVSITVFIVSMIMLYAASTTYHTFDVNPTVNKALKKIDHCMIFVLIAGSYTPICLLVLHGKTGLIMFGIVWGIAILGIVFKLCWVTCPKWISSVLYIGMGWVCIFAFTKIIHSLPTAAFLWLLVGGIIYTIGGVIYALKLPIFNNLHKNFGSHEIFHLFVMGGSLCHYIMMYQYVATMAIK